MSSSSISKIILILGSGAAVGQATAKLFSEHGYKVATVSRSSSGASAGAGTGEDSIHINADLSDPKSLKGVFDRVVEKWNSPPSVVVYNACTHIGDPSGPFSSGITIEEYQKATNVNTVSFFAAATLAIAHNPNVTFLYTGNAGDTGYFPGVSVLCSGKRASTFLIKQAAEAEIEKKKNGSKSWAKFYYLDQRDSIGTPLYKGTLPEPHARKFLELVEQEEQSEPLVIFNSEA